MPLRSLLHGPRLTDPAWRDSKDRSRRSYPMNPEGLDHEPLFVALAWFNGMTATLMVGRLSRWFVAHRETTPRGAVGSRFLAAMPCRRMERAGHPSAWRRSRG